jgi:hypothetical protein
MAFDFYNINFINSTVGIGQHINFGINVFFTGPDTGLMTSIFKVFAQDFNHGRQDEAFGKTTKFFTQATDLFVQLFELFIGFFLGNCQTGNQLF